MSSRRKIHFNQLDYRKKFQPIGDGAWYHLMLVRGKGWKVPSSQSYPIRVKGDVSGPIGDGACYHPVLVKGKGWKVTSLPSLIQSDYRMMFQDQ
jgi:hypothetical protein